jgi:ADP-ribose pyrophosphatase
MQDVRDRSLASARYEALRIDRPTAFGDGPIRIDAREDARCGVVHQDPWNTFVVDPVVMPDGRLGAYGRLLNTVDAEGVAVLPMDGNGDVCLLRHFRHATRAWHLEIPRGFGEQGLPSIEQAAAELFEELALAGDLSPLGHLHPDTGMLAARVALFVAVIPSLVHARHDEGLAEVVRMTRAQFEDAVADGLVTDPFAIAAWTRHELRCRRTSASTDR